MARPWPLLLLGGLLALPVSALPGGGAEREACGAAGGEAATVASVEPGLELRLTDGRLVRLPGIDPARATAARPTLAEEARASLAGWLAGRTILLQPASPAPDRWNRSIAMVYAATGPIEPAAPAAVPADRLLSVGEALIDAGWARARPDPLARACFSRLLAREKEARASGLGLWADPRYAILQAGDRDGLALQAGGLALVEGIVRVRSDRARFRLAFDGARSGFEATVPRHAAKAFARSGLDLEALSGTRVRVRGVLDDRFGARIDLTDPAQVERIEPGGTPAPSAGAREGSKL